MATTTSPVTGDRGGTGGVVQAHRDEYSDDLLTGFDPVTLAAAVDRAVRYWSGTPRTTYLDVAEEFHTEEAVVRTVTPILQRRLRLSATRAW